MTDTVITLEIENNDLDEPHPSPQQMHTWLQSFIGQVCEHRNIGLSIAFVSSPAMQSLNLDYRQKDKSTNVLSFPAHLPAGLPQLFLGDIVFCHTVIADEAEKQHKSLEAHYAHLVIHGTLHLLGYDHIEPEAAQQMEQLEVGFLATLGYPDPYREDA